MSQLQRAMQGFQSEFKRRADRVKRSAYLVELNFSPVESSKFTVTASWKNKDGQFESFSKLYTPEAVFSYSGPRGTRLAKKACRVVDEFTREVLAKRGVFS